MTQSELSELCNAVMNITAVPLNSREDTLADVYNRVLRSQWLEIFELAEEALKNREKHE